MHFWIDKRSQTCGFGRARVAASLSGSTGVGLGFGHPPRRMVGKSLVTPSIHRMQATSGNSSSASGTAAIEFNNRSHNNNNNNNVNNSHNNNNATHNNNSNLNRNNRNHNGNGNNNNNNNTSTAQIHHHENNVSQYHLPSNNNNSNNNNNHGTGLNTRQHYQNVHNQNNIQHSPLPSVNNNQECSIPVTLPQMYGGPSHAQDLEQGSLGLDPIAVRPNLSGVIGGTISTNVAIVDTSDSQLLPSHLKCGMWASLVLASVFVAGAKFYFDHQGTGLEVLIFCAFSATFFLAACTVSLCRLPRDLTATPSQSVDGHNHTLDDNHRIISSNNNINSHLHYHHNQQQQQQLYSQNSEQILEIPITTNPHYQNAHHHQQHQQYYQPSHPNTISAPPPPYHIAILLPENSKNIQLDETPPPSYDKILI